jgi:CRISPR system Cascade subunit CasD
MATLLLRLAGPVQSWAGYRVSPVNVGTFPVPSKTGVAGLLGACLGIKDHRSLMEEFVLDIRVDRANPFGTDLQVASAFKPDEHPIAQRAERVRTVSKVRVRKQLNGTAIPGLFNRDFVPHSEFLVALGGTSEQVAFWHAAVREPVYMPYLGRRPNAPSFPFVLGTSGAAARDLFDAVPRVQRHEQGVDAEYVESGRSRVRAYRIDGDASTLPDPTYVDPPVVLTREEYLSWFSKHLTR